VLILTILYISYSVLYSIILYNKKKMAMNFIKNLQIAAATSIADIGLLAAFMAVNTGNKWMQRNITPTVPGGPYAQMLVEAAIEAAADVSKFTLHDMTAGHMQAPIGGNGGS
jgi:hypothetical protein